jgi:hypothetical protein
VLTNAEISRFWDKVAVRGPDDCWEWQAGCFKRGYGAFAFDGHKPGYAHRFSYELHHGPIPEGMRVLHECDNPPCVNPKHLRAGTQKDNIQDAVNKDRWMTEARQAHLEKVASGTVARGSHGHFEPGWK